MKQTLILGIGNPDREDDGIAWHVLNRLAGHLRQPNDFNLSQPFFDNKKSPDLLFSLQLTPEHIDDIVQYERLCFIDAHTENIKDEIQFIQLDPQFQNSPFTHHLTPESLLFLCKSIYKYTPRAILVSIKGHSFNFSQSLSKETESLVDPVVLKVMEWLQVE